MHAQSTDLHCGQRGALWGRGLAGGQMDHLINPIRLWYMQTDERCIFFLGGGLYSGFHFMMNVFRYIDYRSNVYLSVNVLKLEKHLNSSLRK